MPENSKAAGYLALNVENLRRKKNLSQNQLANTAGIPRSTLTNIESGDGNPSLSNLLKVSAALGVSIEELLSRPRRDCTLITEENVPRQLRSGGKVCIYKMLPDKLKGLEIDKLEFHPHALMAGKPHLAGTKEYLTVLSGEISVIIDAEEYLVKEGDVFAFPGNQLHSYRNKSGRKSIAISVVVPVPAFL